MTTQRDYYLEELRSIRSELGRVLDGIDYCFDWKPNDEEWSAREIVYHLLDTPPGGIHEVVQGALNGSIKSFSITSHLTNLTQERQQRELEGVREDAEAFLTGMGNVLDSTNDAELKETTVMHHSVTQEKTEERTAQNLVEGIFIRHWREHLQQIADLRDALGLE